MGGSGGKGGSQTTTSETTVRLPASLERASNAAISSAFQSASLPYSPNRGITIAGFAPQQEAAMRGADYAAGAFGLPVGQGQYLPEPQVSSQGFRGYSTGGLYDEMLAASMSPADQEARATLLRNYALLGNNTAAREGLGTTPIYGLQSYVPPPPAQPVYGMSSFNNSGDSGHWGRVGWDKGAGFEQGSSVPGKPSSGSVRDSGGGSGGGGK